jgi:hypothetical protein
MSGVICHSLSNEITGGLGRKGEKGLLWISQGSNQTCSTGKSMGFESSRVPFDILAMLRDHTTHF